MVERLYAYALSVVLIGAVAYPFAWEPYEDSFPLSTYPMFSNRLPEPNITVHYALGMEDDGRRHHLEPSLIANEEVLQARAVLTSAVGGGRRATDQLCASVALRVAARPAMHDITSVRIVTGRHDAVAYLTGDDRVGDETVHSTCRVRRAP